MATMLRVAPCGLGMSTSDSHFGVRKSSKRYHSRPAAARDLSSDSCNPLLFMQDAPKQLLSRAGKWTERTKDTELGRAVAPFAASAAFYVQAAGPAFADVAEVLEVDKSEKWFYILATTGVLGVMYLLVIPAFIYNYLRLRWYKRNAAETYFQFLLVFIFFPGLLLLAPFINFRRLPNEGTEPP